jgi:hypothetical protein
MKITKTILAAVLGLAIVGGPLAGVAADKKAKVKPYPLKTCVVSGEKLGEMGDTYVFEHSGREIKLCCKNCLKDFNKAPGKYVKKLEQAEKGEKGDKAKAK